MYATGLRRHNIAPSPAAEAVAALFVNACDLDAPGLSIPRAEAHVVVRFGPKAHQGLDLHVMGARQYARRKRLHRGQQVVTARLRLGTQEAVFGVPASVLAERIVPMEELWGSATARLADQLAKVTDVDEAASLLEHAIAGRLLRAKVHDARTRLALEAAARLNGARVKEVADALGVSERNLRRVFRETIGMSPKGFARLTRFHRALRAARTGSELEWAGVAAEAGYYDQAHLIADFRAIVGVTPRALMDELREGAPALAAGRVSTRGTHAPRSSRSATPSKTEAPDRSPQKASANSCRVSSAGALTCPRLKARSASEA